MSHLDSVRFAGRVLFLSADSAAIERQLAGEELPLQQGGPLRADIISTDEISPAWICNHFDEKLGDYRYLGLHAGKSAPLVACSVKSGGLGITVGVWRYGKGSSREASPLGEWCAGIRLAVARASRAYTISTAAFCRTARLGRGARHLKVHQTLRPAPSLARKPEQEGRQHRGLHHHFRPAENASGAESTGTP